MSHGDSYALPRAQSLLRIFREDPELALVTLVLAVAAALPLFVTPILPFADLHNNTGAASLLREAAFGHGVTASYYTVKFAPIPYWSAYLYIALVEPFVGALWAAKSLCGWLVLLLPLATMRLLGALGRSPRLGLWAFALSWEHNLYSGWVNYLLGMVLALFALAHLIECGSWRRALAGLPLAVLIALTHVEAVAFFLMAGGLVALSSRDRARKVGVYAIWAAGSLLSVVLWLLFRLEDSVARKPAAEILTFDWHSPSQKLGSLYAYTLDHLVTPGDRATAAAFLVLLLGPVMLGCLPQVQGTRRGAVAIFLAALSLYLALPMAMSGAIRHWHTYPRYATYVLLSLLLLPRPRLRGHASLALIPGIAAALWVDMAVMRQFADFGRRARPFLEIIDAVPRDSTILPLRGDFSDPACKIAPYEQFHAYIVAVKKGFDPLLFDTVDNPLLFRQDRHLPRIPRGQTLSMEKQGRFYDFILVQSPSSDPLAHGPDAAAVELVRTAGRWRLYRVKGKKEAEH